MSGDVVRYLQHVLLVDDQAMERPTAAPAGELTPPDDDLEAAPGAGPTEDTSSADPDPGSGPTDRGGPPDTRGLSDGLAAKGVACSIYAPGRPGDQERDYVLNLARISDVVVLDWSYAGFGRDEKGGPTTYEPYKGDELLGAIVETDRQEGGRLRLVVVYTKDSDVEDIADRLERALLAATRLGSVDRPAANVLRAGDVQVSIVGKPANESPLLENRDGHGLADFIFDEFEKRHDGLLPALALSAVAAVRNTAHRILWRFPSSMDAAFVSHAARVGVDEAVDFARYLVGDEIASALATSDVAGFLTAAFLADYADRALSHDGPYIAVANHEAAVEPKVLGKRDAEERLKGLAPKAKDQSFTSLAQGAGDDLAHVRERARTADYHFGGLTLYRRTFLDDGENLPEVTLERGVVVTSPDERSFLLCVLPLCDSARIGSSTRFPFLPLEKETFGLMVPDSRGWRPVSVSDRLSDVVHVTFPAPQELGPVRSTWQEDDGRRTFADTEGRPWLYVGTLRPAQAQRQASALGNAASAVGLDESDWVRRARDARSKLPSEATPGAP